MANSATLTQVRDTFFSGSSPEEFKTRLSQWVADFGLKSEDIKNLTIAALLTRMVAGTKDNALQAILRNAMDTARDAGLADAKAADVLDVK
jgi:hypothetical protein